MQTSLLIHNYLYLIGGIINVGIAILILFNARKHPTSVILTFVAMSLSVATFQVSHLIGTNMEDSKSSHAVLMWNLADIFISIFILHWFLALIGKVPQRRIVLGLVYVSGIAMFVFFLIFPSLFLVDSVPKMYLPFYYEPGMLYFLMPAWFGLVFLYSFWELARTYREEKDPVQKRRLRYVFASIFYAFFVGSTAFLLVFDIPFDPIFSSFFGLYTIPLAYAIIQYELLDIRIIAKRTFMFAITMTIVGIALGAVDFVSAYVDSLHLGIPAWLSPAILSALISTAGIFIWRKARHEDVVKYEFVNIVTHRFRSPLVDIRWAVDFLKKQEGLSSENKEVIGAIENAEIKLTELMSIIVTLNDSDEKKYIYHFSEFDFIDVVKAAALAFKDRCLKKDILFEIEENVDTRVYADQEKLKFVVDVLINNALNYTPQGGSIRIRFATDGKNTEMRIKDSGMGISKQDAPFIFTKFYRSLSARNTDIEGTGVGLYLADEIVRRNGGTISFKSNGVDQGTTFSVSLPKKI